MPRPTTVLAKMVWIDMLQIVLSFCAGVYVGTEYQMMPYVEQVRETLRRMEKQPPEEAKPEEKPPQARSSWFSWGSSSTAEKKRT